MEETPQKVKVIIIDSERGRGQIVERVETFPSCEEAERFIKEFNKPNTDAWNKTHEVPSHYKIARIQRDRKNLLTYFLN